MSALFSASLRVLQQRGVQVLLTLTLYLLTAPYLPTVAHQWLYTISVGIKDLLLWMLPLTVGAFIAHTVCSFQHRAPLFILTLFTFEALSNLASVWYAFACGQVAQEYLPAFSLPTGGQSFSALWQLPLIRPTWWSADKGVALGLLIGGLGAFYESTRLHKAICAGKDIAQWTLTRIFSPLIPLFILGFVARMYQTQLLHHVIAHYSLLLLWLTLFLGIYISLLFLAGSGWSIRRALTAVKI